jgi:hypothetical protein
VAAKVPAVTDLSDTSGTLASGPESRFVVDALGRLLDGDGSGVRDQLAAGAGATSWAAVLHRLDVAGRALALDAGLDPADAARWARRGEALATSARLDPVPAGLDQVVAAWSSGQGAPACIDLTTEAVDATPEDERALAACTVLAVLVDASGFPPQVVA